MKTSCLLMILLSSCATPYKYGKVSEVTYAGYNYRNVLIGYPDYVFPGFKGEVISNMKFCNDKSDCHMVFEGQNQYFTYTTFIDSRDQNGLRKRIFLYETYITDTNGDDIVNGNDLSTIYAYEPVEMRLTKLAENVRYLDMESNVTDFSFFILYEKEGERILSQYSMRDLDEIRRINK